MSTIDAPSGLPLELAGVTLAIAGRPLLGPLDLRLARGPLTIVLGPNGAGKSLLMRVCHGLIAPTGGRIRLGSSDVPGARRRQAMVFQKPVLLRRSALRNVTYALAAAGVPWRERRMRAEAALERFGLTALAGRAARVLSGGEQQRLALARAWAIEPELLFLDEPTASLDPSAVRTFEAALSAFQERGTKIVMATHDLGQARRLADEVLFLCGGHLLEKTAATQFFTRPRSNEARGYLGGEIVG